MASTHVPVWIALTLFAAQTASAAYYSLNGFPNGARLWIGEVSMPVDTYMSASTGMPTGTMFPLLLIPRKGSLPPYGPPPLVQQTGGPDPKKLTIPPGVLFRKAYGPRAVGVAKRNPRMFQVRTNFAFSAPGMSFGTAFLAAGGRSGAATTTFVGPGGTAIRYRKTAAQFGGPAQIQVLPASPIRKWLRSSSIKAPCKHPTFGGNSASLNDAGCLGVLVGPNPGKLAAPGAEVGFVTGTTHPALMTGGIRVLSVPSSTGLVNMSAVAAMTAPQTDMATSLGFPWTTGNITVSAPAAKGSPEIFHLTGMDARVNGIGTISLVSGALSNRTYSGSNANRGWIQLTVPEPGAWVSTAAAFSALAVCHLLGRGRKH